MGREQRDSRRDAYLQRCGYRVLHLDSALVLRDLAGALALVSHFLA